MSAAMMAIARAIGASRDMPNHTDRARIVVDALREAGWRLVPEELADPMAWAMCPLVQDDGNACGQCPSREKAPDGRGSIRGCRWQYRRIWAAVLESAPDPTVTP